MDAMTTTGESNWSSRLRNIAVALLVTRVSNRVQYSVVYLTILVICSHGWKRRERFSLTRKQRYYCSTLVMVSPVVNCIAKTFVDLRPMQRRARVGRVRVDVAEACMLSNSTQGFLWLPIVLLIWKLFLDDFHTCKPKFSFNGWLVSRRGACCCCTYSSDQSGPTCHPVRTPGRTMSNIRRLKWNT